MRKHILLLSSLALCAVSLLASPIPEGEGLGERSERPSLPAYEIVGKDTTCNIFLYSPNAAEGLHVAYLADNEQWQDMGSLCGSEYDKQGNMYNPYVFQAADGSWRMLFGVGGDTPFFGVAYSEDLVAWRPQDFPKMKERGVTKPVAFQMDDGSFDIYFKAADGTRHYVKGDKDFRHFVEDSVASSISDDAWIMDTATVAGHCYDGNQYEVPKIQLDYIAQYFQAMDNEAKMNAETFKDDAERFKNLGTNISATLTIDPSKSKKISSHLFGLDINDISRMAKGGLYAELLNDSIKKIPHNDMAVVHALITKRDTLYNNGWDGIKASLGQQFDFSVDLRVTDGKKSQALVVLVDNNGVEYAKEKIKLESTGWQHCALPLIIEDNRKDKTQAVTTEKLCLALTALKDDSIEVRNVSLFPHETFKGGRMKADLGEKISALTPKFIRIPSDIASNGHGATLFDYFKFCKDIDAEPVLDIPTDANISDIVNNVLGEATADTMPAQLKRVVIGSGDRVNTFYEEHFQTLAKAIKEKYPDIALVSSSGSKHNPSSDYAEGWMFAKANKNVVGMVSERYEATPGWLMHHQDYYDGYDRKAQKVCIDRPILTGTDSMENALVKSLYLCSLERNADVVDMVCNTVDDATRMWLTNSGDVYMSSSLTLDGDSIQSKCGYRVASSVVRDSAGKTFVKVVNALPSILTIDIKGQNVADGTAVNGFTCKPSRQQIKTKVEGQQVTIPAYSVIAIQVN